MAIAMPGLRVRLKTASCITTLAWLVAAGVSAMAQQVRTDPTPGPVANGLVGLTFNATYESFDYPAVIYVRDGKVDAAKSHKDQITAGRFTGRSADGIHIAVRADRSNGIYVAGKTDFTLSRAKIEVFGNSAGWDENFGLGAGATVGEGATLTVRDSTIESHGIKALALAAANGTLRVYKSRLHAFGGNVPAQNMIPGTGPGYVGAPEALNIVGTARTANVVGSGKAYYYDSTIISEGWGALSTDSARPYVYLEINNCDVEARNGGYGVYADIGAEVVANGSRFRSADYTGIISGDGKIRLNDVTEDGAIHGIMMHAPGQDFLKTADLRIKGGHFRTRKASILVLSTNADIDLDGVDLQPADGVLLRSEINPSKRQPLLRWLLDPKKQADIATGPVTGIHLTLRNMTATGAIEHADTTRPLIIDLVGTVLKGSVTGSVWTISDVTVRMGAGARWSATQDSRVTLLGATDAGAFDAPAGITITAIAGKGTTLKGSYALPGGGTLIVKN
ncbi:hypothetical protein [Novosphingobium resinovorum]|uniref:hypothetical protein n=1 Tax=Novosphingobium resinovorum TaxID=158500 RepID=UPI002ED6B4C8|nr:hypothetical protein [Novosphingobium resinovorum]